MHGPLQLLREGFPVIAFRQNDAAAEAMAAAVDRLRAVKGRVFVAEATPQGPDGLPVAPTGHGALDPLSALLSFYGLAEEVARARGHDPDTPSLLRKVTETV
jgi:glucosamine--fructose-6-phosphate aminotransferase (isomerizing)